MSIRSFLKYTKVVLVGLLVLVASACNPHMSPGSPHFNISKFQFYTKASKSGIDHAQYLKLMNEVEHLYSPIVEQHGGELRMLTEYWEKDAVHGATNRNGAWNIKIYGGYARHPLANSDAVLFLACHELGHHLGGMPYYPPPNSWGAAEGQADYFASLKCMRKFLQGKNNKGYLAKIKVPQIVVDQCRGAFKQEEEQYICQRTAMAGYRMNSIWVGGKARFRFDTPSPKVVETSYIKHPSYQCRLDTYFQGALCPVPDQVDLDFDDFRIGSCTIANNDKVGLRPACWFRESEF